MVALQNLHMDDAHVDNPSKIIIYSCQNEGYKHMTNLGYYMTILFWFLTLINKAAIDQSQQYIYSICILILNVL